LQPVGAHQPLDPFAAHPPALAAQRGVHPRAAVGAARRLVDLADLRQKLFVLTSPTARVGSLLDPAVVGRGRHPDDPEDRLDPEAVTQLVHQHHDRRRVGSSSWAKTALAAFKISLTRRSSAFSRRSRRNSSSSAVVNRSRRRPRSASSWRIQLRNASGCTPNCSASRRITGFGSDSRYKRTARARNSSGYFLGAATKTPFLVHQTMIESLRKTGGSSTGPKIVASTATTKRAAAQVLGVFARQLAIFPPPVIDVGDTFFSR